MAIIRQSPLTYNTTSTGAIVTASSGANYQIGFRPVYMRIENLGTVDLWATFNSTSIAGTCGILIKSCEAAARFLEIRDPVCPSIVSLAATSTAASGASIFALGLP